MTEVLKQKYKIKLGYAPTRRDVFSKVDAQKHKIITENKLKNMGVEICNLDWLNEEGLLFNSADVGKIEERFKSEKVDAVFFPHCNFGTEDAVAKLAKKLQVPVLLWGPRDDVPLENGSRTRDSQCGLFATSKVLGRFGVPFSYISNSGIEDEVFLKGIKNFLGTAAVVKASKNLRIGQIGPRPGGFWSVICNEGELLERFGVQTVPITLVDITKWTQDIISKKNSVLDAAVEDIKQKVNCSKIGDEALLKLAALKIAIKNWASAEGLSAVAIQCWTSLQDILGVMPCFVNAELTDDGLPVVCETDIHGAITAIFAQAANMGESSVFFADLTIRHPHNDSAELLWHCGNFPNSLAKDNSHAYLDNHDILPGHCPGVGQWEIKRGDITICRFDGMQGKYSLLMGHGKAVEGPGTKGTYVWFETSNWPLWEEKLIYGPYIHHCAGVYGRVAPVLYEACRYIPGLEADPVSPTEEEIRKFLRE